MLLFEFIMQEIFPIFQMTRMKVDRNLFNLLTNLQVC